MILKKCNSGIIISIFLILKPIYLWRSGGVQLCDIFLLMSTMFLFMKHKAVFSLDKRQIAPISLFTGLCIYQLLVNTVWTGVLGDNLLKSSLYYAFNLIAFFDLIIIGNDIGIDSLKKSIAYGCLISLGISSLGLILAGAGGRRVGFFNNPNQLGYYALVLFSLTFLCKDQIKGFVFYLMLILSTWAIIASGSKAAFIAVVGMYAIYIFSADKRFSFKKIIPRLIMLIVFSSAIYLFFFSDNKIVLSNPTIYFMRRRMLLMGTENDTALGTGRGYDRIFEIGFHFLWGMGEGANYRFNTMTGMEAHSSYVTLLVCYGLIGLFGYGKLLINCIIHRGYTVRNLFVFSGILFYGVSHNGLRNTLVWMLLALLLMDSVPAKKENASFIY